ncbi:PREDICTED: kinesin-like protein KIN-4C isoform X2 [Lupinus angustifolius]|uniref:kinesin-like protein KIN-4C isoform X2 n=1 Tax=Lupinus angustifolius TaxID=3871 RepID=UPI00092E4FAB|nr:PREDICTED: kinesin-like protein KIN-4C isoform X2 [Lupinus angustifolius]
MEIEELRQQKGNDSSASNNGVEKLKKDYLQKLNLLEDQVAELKKKVGSQSQFSTHRKRVDESTNQLHCEIQSLKAQKVQLQCKLKLESVQFRLCKALLEKEVLQLKKDGRRNEFKTCSLLASNERLKMVLQRKTEEASAATNRLKEMIEARKVISNRLSGPRKDRNNQVIQDAENEHEVTSQLHDLCSQYESIMEKMAEENSKLKEEIELQKQEKLRSPSQEEDCDSLEKDLDIQDLKEQVNVLSDLLRELQLKKEKLDCKDNKQNLLQPLFSDKSNDKLLLEIDTPETYSSNGSNVKKERTAEGLCCSCSKKSLCKTKNCRCRSTGGRCGPSCGCTHSKCTNREPKSENTECVMNDSAVDEDASVAASECAKLLQSALVLNPPGPIKNSLAKLDAEKPGKKNKARKPVIHIVAEDPASSSLDNNSGQANDFTTVISDKPGIRHLRTRQPKAIVGKENNFI